MTNTGQQADDLARQRATEVVDAIRRRALREVHHERTDRVELPAEYVARLEAMERFVTAAAQDIAQLNLVLIELQRDIAALREALARHGHTFDLGRFRGFALINGQRVPVEIERAEEAA